MPMPTIEEYAAFYRDDMIAELKTVKLMAKLSDDAHAGNYDAIPEELRQMYREAVALTYNGPPMKQVVQGYVIAKMQSGEM